MNRKHLAWPAGIAAGLVVAIPAATIPQNDPPSAEWNPLGAAQASDPGDYITSAADQVRTSHFWAAPEVAGRLSEAAIDDLVDLASASPVPLYVAYVGAYDLAPDTGFNTSYAGLDQLMALVGEDGYYAVIDERGAAITEAIGFDDPYVDSSLLDGRPAQGLTRYLTALSEVPADEPYDGGGSDFDYWGGPVGGALAGLLMAVPAWALLVGLSAVVGAAVRPRRKETRG